ncbi:sulfite exporter TauE/SafE family protein [Clostridium tepidum]|uniref:Probable membrane transporter protein n=1 Tax=Clostridium tepidum TaxID=1962263 RepID=A0A1S9HZK0_9CLOT|nr:sulfite exporter TauE/SafE family protein [Clostridium tepidum]OOO61216.1 permease [Clostridium tepidum]OOO63438.1 permease [Clostridium tepidum]
MMTKLLLLVLLVLTIYFLFFFLKDYFKSVKRGDLENNNFFIVGIIGLVVNFFDTLGIGSFAPLTSMLKFFKQTKDKVIPGTLNVGCTVPMILQAFIFMTSIKVEPVTLISMILAAMIGSLFGAEIVSKLDEKKVQFCMGVSLLIVALIILAGQLHLMPAGGNDIGLYGSKLIIAIVGNFILGILMTVGIGLYAPCMALVCVLGMNPKVAFPIMMGSCAFLLPISSTKFIKNNAYDKKASISISLFGAVGVLIAAFIVKELPVKVLTWLVIGVIIYTSITMFKAYYCKTENYETREELA